MLYATVEYVIYILNNLYFVTGLNRKCISVVSRNEGVNQPSFSAHLSNLWNVQCYWVGDNQYSHV